MKCIKDRLKKPWPYWIGGILLGILNVALLVITGVAWHVTSGFCYGVQQYWTFWELNH